MPTYDYLCDACGHALEMFQMMSEAPKRKCPSCGAPKLRRLIGTGAGVLFKGSGFYQTDYRSDSYKQAAKNDKSSSGSSPSASASDKSSTPTPPAQKKEASSDKPAGKSDSGGASKPAS
jgi:putative FmdB family regulatory protein